MCVCECECDCLVIGIHAYHTHAYHTHAHHTHACVRACMRLEIQANALFGAVCMPLARFDCHAHVSAELISGAGVLIDR